MFEDFSRDALDVIVHMCEEADVSFSQSDFIPGSLVNVYEIENGYNVVLDVSGHRDVLLDFGYDMIQKDVWLYVWKSGRNASSVDYLHLALKQWLKENFWDLRREEVNGYAVWFRGNTGVFCAKVSDIENKRPNDDYDVWVRKDLIMMYLSTIGKEGLAYWWISNAYGLVDYTVRHIYGGQGFVASLVN